MIFSKELSDAFRTTIADNRDAARLFCNRDDAWHHLVVQGLVAAARRASPEGRISTKYDSFASSHATALAMDVVAADDGWKPPQFAALHEQAMDPTAVQYSAWQLLTSEANKRVLVAYWAPRSKGLSSFEKLQGLALEVCAAQPKKDILLVAMNARATPTCSADVAALVQTSIIGIWSERRALHVALRSAAR